MSAKQQVLESILDRRSQAPERVTIVGIDGPTASGKTYFAKWLQQALHDQKIRCEIYQLDWLLTSRPFREEDVKRLNTSKENFPFEGELHMRLELAREFLQTVQQFQERPAAETAATKVVQLENLYNREGGGTTDGTAEIALAAGSVVILEGHYTLRNDLSELIDLQVCMLANKDVLVQRKVDRVKGYRSPDAAVNYFDCVDGPSFEHHFSRFRDNGAFMIDNSDYEKPSVLDRTQTTAWHQRFRQECGITLGADSTPTQWDEPGLIRQVFSESKTIPQEFYDFQLEVVRLAHELDGAIAKMSRTAVDEQSQDFRSYLDKGLARINEQFGEAGSVQLVYADHLHNIYYRKMPICTAVQARWKNNPNLDATVFFTFSFASLKVAYFWAGGCRHFLNQRMLGQIDSEDQRSFVEQLAEGARTQDKIKVTLPTDYTFPSFLAKFQDRIEKVYTGKELQNVSPVSLLLDQTLRNGVWIQRLTYHWQIDHFAHLLNQSGIHSLHVGNYLIAVHSQDSELLQEFQQFVAQWRPKVSFAERMQQGWQQCDELVAAETQRVKQTFAEQAKNLKLMDGQVFGNCVSHGKTAQAVQDELSQLLNSPERLVRKKTVHFIEEHFPALQLRTQNLWENIPEGSKQTITLKELMSLSPTILAEVHLWSALRGDCKSVLGANVYDIRPESIDCYAFLKAACELSAPIVLQSSMNAVGQKEEHEGGVAWGYLHPSNGCVDFAQAALQAARNLLLTTGTRPGLFGVGMDHITSGHDKPSGRAKRLLNQAIREGRITHLVLDASDLFNMETPDKALMRKTFREMAQWVVSLFENVNESYLKDFEVCISELNYIGGSKTMILPDEDDVEVFVEEYQNALIEAGFGAHLSRPHLFIPNLGTVHHGADDEQPWVEKSGDLKDRIKSAGFVSAVLHGTSNSHWETLSKASVGCHKINVAGDFLVTLVHGLPEELTRAVLRSEIEPKKQIASIRDRMNSLTPVQSERLSHTLTSKCVEILQSVNTTRLTPLDTAYFHYPDFVLEDRVVQEILAAIRGQVEEIRVTDNREPLDKRTKKTFAASMIEVPINEFQSGDLLENIHQAGVRFFHIDVGDGELIPRKFSGLEKIEFLKQHFPDVATHVHFMAHSPHIPGSTGRSLIDEYAEAGADAMAVHRRAFHNENELRAALLNIQSKGVRPGILVETHESIDDELKQIIAELKLDWIIVMGVPIGFGGQLFQNSSLLTIASLYEFGRTLGRDFLIEVDGGLNTDNISLCEKAGAQLFAGWSIVKDTEPKKVREKIQHVQSLIEGAPL